jgi:hypothetical protein
MTWTGPRKPTYLQLPEDLHHEMKAAGALSGRKIAEVYIEAATLWLGITQAKVGVTIESPGQIGTKVQGAKAVVHQQVYPGEPSRE